ncbi:hypothetical protein HW132_03335 [Brasilonema sp. CT11]|nr:hypothetical protein [Brasilonema sp. CT11]
MHSECQFLDVQDPDGNEYTIKLEQDRFTVLPIAKNDKSRFVSPCAGDTCKAVNKNLIKEQSYPEELIKNLYVIIKRDGRSKQQVGIAYANLLLSDEGQNLVEKAGFFPVRLVTEP